MAKTRILFVDDEPGIRLTLPAVLAMHGFEVVTAGDVPEALALIQRESFDVLLSDLNIGQPGDGFTVVSAMRRTQPNVVTMIITGFPAFETALEAIRKQVDDYIVKPADTSQLIDMIESKLQQRKPHTAHQLRRVGEIISENLGNVFEGWLRQCKHHPELKVLKLSDMDRVNPLSAMVRELVSDLDHDELGSPPSPALQRAIEEFSSARGQQGYSLELMLQEIRILRIALLEEVQGNLLGINISFMVQDIVRLQDRLSQAGIVAVRNFQNARSPRLRGSSLQ